MTQQHHPDDNTPDWNPIEPWSTGRTEFTFAIVFEADTTFKPNELRIQLRDELQRRGIYNASITVSRRAVEPRI
jgi:hypothetical protein